MGGPEAQARAEAQAFERRYLQQARARNVNDALKRAEQEERQGNLQARDWWLDHAIHCEE
jgi:hypothetical protein